jgi:hypothetical protein
MATRADNGYATPVANPPTRQPDDDAIHKMYIPFMDGYDHPTAVRQTSVSQLAQPDALTYDEITTLVHESLRNGKALSAVQLDAVALAAKCFQQETAFIVGDATGLGKGRTAVGILRNTWLTLSPKVTARRALYFSTPQLFETLKRDVDAVFTAEERRNLTVVSLKDFKPADRRKRPVGDEIIFVSYSMLAGKHSGRDLNFLTKYITGAPNGKVPLLVDESHTIKNCNLQGKGGSQAAKAALTLFTNTRASTAITFLSATFAANLEDLRLYASFVGLEGQLPNSVGFPSFDHLRRKMGANKDASSLEFISAELIRSGKMVSRVLAFDGVEFSEVVVKLDKEWWVQSDAASLLFEDLQILGIFRPYQRAAHFYGRQMCFFKALALSGKVARTVEVAKKQLAAGHQVVISLMGTGEAAAKRAVHNSQQAMQRNSGGPEDDISGVSDAGVRDTLFALLDNAAEYHRVDTGEVYEPLEEANLWDLKPCYVNTGSGAGLALASEPGDECLIRGDAWIGAMSYPMFRGATGSVLQVDENGEWARVQIGPLLLPRNRGIAETHCSVFVHVDELQRLTKMPQPEECFASTGGQLYVLKRRAACLPLPVVSPLDALKQELGGSQAVAELTGRKTFLERSSTREGVWEQVPNYSNPQLEIDSFQRGEKKVALLSQACSSGLSLHADRDMNPNAPRRSQLVFEWPWTAIKAMQCLGRTHRARQLSAPEYVLITSDSGPDQRFAATVASRLTELGAMSLGERSSLTAGAKLRLRGAGDIDAEQFVSTRGLEAVMRLFNDPMRKTVFARMGLEEATSITGRKFLNRVMALPQSISKELFEAFIDALEQTIFNAQQKGTISSPIETLVIDGERGKHVQTLTSPKLDGTIDHYRVDRGLTIEDALKKQQEIMDMDWGPEDVFFGYVNEPEKGPVPALIWARNARTYVRFTPLGEQKFGSVDHLPMEVDVDAELKRAWKKVYDDGNNEEPRVELKRVLMLPSMRAVKAINTPNGVKLCKLAFSDGKQTLGVDLGTHQSGKSISDDQLTNFGFRTEEGHKQQKALEEKQAEDKRKAEERLAFQRQQAAEDSAKGLAPLPPGWTVERNDQGQVYYAHAASSKTQWERPTAAAPAAAPAAARGASVFRAAPANNVLKSSLASMEKTAPVVQGVVAAHPAAKGMTAASVAMAVRQSQTYQFDGMVTMAKLREKFGFSGPSRPGTEEAFAKAVAESCEVGKISFKTKDGTDVSPEIECVIVKKDYLKKTQGLFPTPADTEELFDRVRQAKASAADDHLQARRQLYEQIRSGKDSGAASSSGATVAENHKRKADDAFAHDEYAEARNELVKLKETIQRMKDTIADLCEAGADATENKKALVRAELAYRKKLNEVGKMSIAFK